MGDDESKKTILARRARFLAAAMTTAGITSSCCDKVTPDPCLEPPQVCLTVAIPEADAGEGGDATSPHPHVCLEYVPSDLDASKKNTPAR
jgi:hypothetical protein